MTEVEQTAQGKKYQSIDFQNKNDSTYKPENDINYKKISNLEQLEKRISQFNMIDQQNKQLFNNPSKYNVNINNEQNNLKYEENSGSSKNNKASIDKRMNTTYFDNKQQNQNQNKNDNQMTFKTMYNQSLLKQAPSQIQDEYFYDSSKKIRTLVEQNNLDKTPKQDNQVLYTHGTYAHRQKQKNQLGNGGDQDNQKSAKILGNYRKSYQQNQTAKNLVQIKIQRNQSVNFTSNFMNKSGFGSKSILGQMGTSRDGQISPIKKFESTLQSPVGKITHKTLSQALNSQINTGNQNTSQNLGVPQNGQFRINLQLNNNLNIDQSQQIQMGSQNISFADFENQAYNQKELLEDLIEEFPQEEAYTNFTDYNGKNYKQQVEEQKSQQQQQPQQQQEWLKKCLEQYVQENLNNGIQNNNFQFSQLQNWLKSQLKEILNEERVSFKKMDEIFNYKNLRNTELQRRKSMIQRAEECIMVAFNEIIRQITNESQEKGNLLFQIFGALMNLNKKNQNVQELEKKYQFQEYLVKSKMDTKYIGEKNLQKQKDEQIQQLLSHLRDKEIEIMKQQVQAEYLEGQKKQMQNQIVKQEEKIKNLKSLTVNYYKQVKFMKKKGDAKLKALKKNFELKQKNQMNSSYNGNNFLNVENNINNNQNNNENIKDQSVNNNNQNKVQINAGNNQTANKMNLSNVSNKSGTSIKKKIKKKKQDNTEYQYDDSENDEDMENAMDISFSDIIQQEMEKLKEKEKYSGGIQIQTEEKDYKFKVNQDTQTDPFQCMNYLKSVKTQTEVQLIDKKYDKIMTPLQIEIHLKELEINNQILRIQEQSYDYGNNNYNYGAKNINEQENKKNQNDNQTEKEINEKKKQEQNRIQIKDILEGLPVFQKQGPGYQYNAMEHFFKNLFVFKEFMEVSYYNTQLLEREVGGYRRQSVISGDLDKQQIRQPFGRDGNRYISHRRSGYFQASELQSGNSFIQNDSLNSSQQSHSNLPLKKDNSQSNILVSNNTNGNINNNNQVGNQQGNNNQQLHKMVKNALEVLEEEKMDQSYQNGKKEIKQSLQQQQQQKNAFPVKRKPQKQKSTIVLNEQYNGFSRRDSVLQGQTKQKSIILANGTDNSGSKKNQQKLEKITKNNGSVLDKLDQQQKEKLYNELLEHSIQDHRKNYNKNNNNKGNNNNINNQSVISEEGSVYLKSYKPVYLDKAFQEQVLCIVHLFNLEQEKVKNMQEGIQELVKILKELFKFSKVLFMHIKKSLTQQQQSIFESFSQQFSTIRWKLPKEIDSQFESDINKNEKEQSQGENQTRKLKFKKKGDFFHFNMFQRAQKMSLKNKQNNPGTIIVTKIRDGIIKKGHYLSLKFVLKQISQLYDERIRMIRENRVDEDLDMPIFCFQKFMQYFGFKSVAESKLDNVQNLTQSEMIKYFNALEFIKNISKYGTAINNLESDLTYNVPYLKVVDYIRVHLEPVFAQDQLNEIKNWVENNKLQDLNFQYNNQQYLEFDNFMNEVLKRYRTILKSAQQHAIHAFQAADLDGNGTISLSEFLTLYRHIESNKFNFDEVLDLFERQADVVTEGEKNLSFDKFTSLCVEKRIFSEKVQNLFIVVMNEEQVREKYLILKTNFEKEKREIQSNLNQLKEYVLPETYENWILILDNLQKRMEQANVDQKPTLLGHKVLKNELERLIEEGKRNAELGDAFQDDSDEDEDEREFYHNLNQIKAQSSQKNDEVDEKGELYDLDNINAKQEAKEILKAFMEIENEADLIKHKHQTKTGVYKSDRQLSKNLNKWDTKKIQNQNINKNKNEDFDQYSANFDKYQNQKISNINDLSNRISMYNDEDNKGEILSQKIQFLQNQYQQQEKEEDQLQNDMKIALELINKRKSMNKATTSQTGFMDKKMLEMEIRHEKIKKKREERIQKQHETELEQKKGDDFSSGKKKGQNLKQNQQNDDKIQNLKERRNILQKQQVYDVEQDIDSLKKGFRQEIANNIKYMKKTQEAGRSLQDFSEINKIYEEAQESKNKYNKFRAEKMMKKLNFIIMQKKRSYFRAFQEILQEEKEEDLYMFQQSQKILGFKKKKRLFLGWYIVVCNQIAEEQCKRKLEDEEVEQKQILERAYTYYLRKIARKCFKSWKNFREIRMQQYQQEVQNNVLKQKVNSFVDQLKNKLQRNEKKFLEKNKEYEYVQGQNQEYQEFQQEYKENEEEQVEQDYIQVNEDYIKRNQIKNEVKKMKKEQQILEDHTKQIQELNQKKLKLSDFDKKFEQEAYKLQQEQKQIQDKIKQEEKLLQIQQNSKYTTPEKDNNIENENDNYIDEDLQEESLFEISQQDDNQRNSGSYQDNNSINWSRQGKSNNQNRYGSVDKSQSQNLNLSQNSQNLSQNQEKMSSEKKAEILQRKKEKEIERLKKLKEIELRAQKRKEAAEQIKKKHEEQKRQKELEKQKKEQEALEKERLKREEYQKEQQLKKQQEKERKEQLQFQKEEMLRKQKMAVEFYQKQQLKFFGILPWKKFCQRNFEKFLEAVEIDNLRIQKSAFQFLKEGIRVVKKEKQIEMQYKSQRAILHYEKQMKSKILYILQVNVAEEQEWAAQFVNVRPQFLQKLAFQKWAQNLNELRNENIKIEMEQKKLIEDFQRGVLLNRYFKEWQFQAGEEKRNQLREQNKQQMWGKVNNWLKELEEKDNISGLYDIKINEDQIQNNKNKLNHQNDFKKQNQYQSENDDYMNNYQRH
ncbi:hypothetical protein PPERSA_01842 [Pseudocohnilembus persalinus]|uniref:EF-hand domain-containing protein n=1 Tax=Pseudocohnilembus persalinus TaxID=266149 RepID=A0A0V0QL92_PSEPJ|nr:hypothetical protein PPERSA_01842 [Pseudocohnilembus persalinus]|eukprot:KRX02725.1 hypothetical protein PPERSA_01842 [Pseudocohnilembus persalinus]